jgi:hypothetical protein
MERRTLTPVSKVAIQQILHWVFYLPKEHFTLNGEAQTQKEIEAQGYQLFVCWYCILHARGVACGRNRLRSIMALGLHITVSRNRAVHRTEVVLVMRHVRVGRNPQCIIW